MDELEYYSPEQIEDMELQDWEINDQSDLELMGELLSIEAVNSFEPDPHLDADRRVALAEVKRRGLLIDDDWECEECRERNRFDCDWCQACGAQKGMLY